VPGYVKCAKIKGCPLAGSSRFLALFDSFAVDFSLILPEFAGVLNDGTSGAAGWGVPELAAISVKVRGKLESILAVGI